MKPKSLTRAKVASEAMRPTPTARRRLRPGGRDDIRRAPPTRPEGSGSLAAAGAQVRRYKKPTFTKPAPVDLRHEIATQCTLVIEALAD